MTADDFKYGLRYDPTPWVETDSSLQAALVRTQVFGRPTDGDRAALNAALRDIAAEQQSDGTFGGCEDTGSRLLDLLELGADHNSATVEKAVDAILGPMRAGANAHQWYDEGGTVLSIYALHAFCLLGMSEVEEVRHSLRWFVDHPEKWNDPWVGCPWTPAVFLRALWVARAFDGVAAVVANGLRRVLDQMNAAGCCGYNDPWGLTEAASGMDSPEARALIERQLPMILRSQRPGGHWRHHSLKVFRALTTHGLLDRLRALPPLPPDWKIVRELPLPPGRWQSLTWDGQCFWSIDGDKQEAARINPADGGITRRVSANAATALAWWGGDLAAVSSEPKQLRRIHAETGAVLGTVSLERLGDVCDCEIQDGRVIIGDGFECNVWLLDPDHPERADQQVLAGPGPAWLAAHGDTLWHVDFWAHALICTGPDRRLLEWGEKALSNVKGLACDGAYLWLLDGDRHRLCAIEKAATPETPPEPL